MIQNSTESYSSINRSFCKVKKNLTLFDGGRMISVNGPNFAHVFWRSSFLVWKFENPTKLYFQNNKIRTRKSNFSLLPEIVSEWCGFFFRIYEISNFYRPGEIPDDDAECLVLRISVDVLHLQALAGLFVLSIIFIRTLHFSLLHFNRLLILGFIRQLSTVFWKFRLLLKKNL